MSRNSNRGGARETNTEEADMMSSLTDNDDEITTYGSEYAAEVSATKAERIAQKSATGKEEDDPCKDTENSFERKAIVGRSPTVNREDRRQSESQAGSEAVSLKEVADRRKTVTIRDRDRANSLPDVRVHRKKIFPWDDEQDEIEIDCNLVN